MVAARNHVTARVGVWTSGQLRREERHRRWVRPPTPATHGRPVARHVVRRPRTSPLRAGTLRRTAQLGWMGTGLFALLTLEPVHLSVQASPSLAPWSSVLSAAVAVGARSTCVPSASLDQIHHLGHDLALATEGDT